MNQEKNDYTFFVEFQDKRDEISSKLDNLTITDEEGNRFLDLRNLDANGLYLLKTYLNHNLSIHLRHLPTFNQK